MNRRLLLCQLIESGLGLVLSASNTHLLGYEPGSAENDDRDDDDPPRVGALLHVGSE